MSDNRWVSVDYFSDVLCIWAYVAQIRLDELRKSFPEQVRVTYRFIPVFGDVQGKMQGWSDRGGIAGYGRHVHEVAERFGHVPVHAEIWARNTPAGSLSAHAFIKSVDLLCRDGELSSESVAAFDGRTTLEELMWRVRLAFFRDVRDIARLDVQLELARELDLPVDRIRLHLEDGRALAALSEDHESAQRSRVTGSPTYLFNEGRQTLYGNVGYRIIEANVQELLRDHSDRASWC